MRMRLEILAHAVDVSKRQVIPPVHNRGSAVPRNETTIDSRPDCRRYCRPYDRNSVHVIDDAHVLCTVEKTRKSTLAANSARISYMDCAKSVALEHLRCEDDGNVFAM